MDGFGIVNLQGRNCQVRPPLGRRPIGCRHQNGVGPCGAEWLRRQDEASHDRADRHGHPGHPGGATTDGCHEPAAHRNGGAARCGQLRRSQGREQEVYSQGWQGDLHRCGEEHWWRDAQASLERRHALGHGPIGQAPFGDLAQERPFDCERLACPWGKQAVRLSDHHGAERQALQRGGRRRGGPHPTRRRLRRCAGTHQGHPAHTRGWLT